MTTGPPRISDPSRRSVVWFKRDLRVVDHGPLARAAERGEAVGLYVYEPEVVGAAEHDASHLGFVNECLAELRERLRGAGSELLIRRGAMPEVLDHLRAAWRFDHLWSHEETGLVATFERDKRVAAWCEQRSVRWTEIAQHGVVRRLGSRDGWAARWRRRMASRPLVAPSGMQPPAVALEPGEILSGEQLGLPPTTITERQRGGASRGLALLSSFLHERGETYQRAMSTPVEGWDACSRVSPHLAYGSVSIRQAFHAARERAGELEGQEGAAAWRRSIASFEKRLRWHCHFIQKLEDEPAIEFRNFSRAYDGLRQEDPLAWTSDERDRFRAYEQGTTGYPFVDACLRCLARTGWINFRMRAMLMSFAAYHLWLHWKPVATLLARRFLDFEPGIHYSQCQMQSGVTGINTVRIYSPIKQAADQDSGGVFTRRWLPELAELPDEHLAQPHRAPELTLRMAGVELGMDYPRPIVDHGEAYNEAKRRVFAVRKTARARSEAVRVYKKHGSRKRPAARR